jgi:hypothetical protein
MPTYLYRTLILGCALRTHETCHENIIVKKLYGEVQSSFKTRILYQEQNSIDAHLLSILNTAMCAPPVSYRILTHESSLNT